MGEAVAPSALAGMIRAQVRCARRSPLPLVATGIPPLLLVLLLGAVMVARSGRGEPVAALSHALATALALGLALASFAGFGGEIVRLRRIGVGTELSLTPLGAARHLVAVAVPGAAIAALDVVLFGGAVALSQHSAGAALGAGAAAVGTGIVLLLALFALAAVVTSRASRSEVVSAPLTLGPVLLIVLGYAGTLLPGETDAVYLIAATPGDWVLRMLTAAPGPGLLAANGICALVAVIGGPLALVLWRWNGPESARRSRSPRSGDRSRSARRAWRSRKPPRPPSASTASRYTVWTLARFHLRSWARDRKRLAAALTWPVVLVVCAGYLAVLVGGRSGLVAGPLCPDQSCLGRTLFAEALTRAVPVCVAGFAVTQMAAWMVSAGESGLLTALATTPLRARTLMLAYLPSTLAYTVGLTALCYLGLGLLTGSLVAVQPTRLAATLLIIALFAQGLALFLAARIRSRTVLEGLGVAVLLFGAFPIVLAPSLREAPAWVEQLSPFTWAGAALRPDLVSLPTSGAVWLPLFGVFLLGALLAVGGARMFRWHSAPDRRPTHANGPTPGGMDPDVQPR